MAGHVLKCMSLQDTWQAMCQLAWNVKFSINGRKSVRVKGSQEEKREKRKREKKKRTERNRDGRRRKGERKREKRKSAFRQLELVGPRSKFRRFNEGLRFKR